MTHEELNGALETLGLSTGAMAKVLGVDIRTARRWSTGAKAIPDSVASQVAAMLEAGGVTPQMAAEIQTERLANEPDVTRYLWVKVKDRDPIWTVAEHDRISDIYYIPGRLDRYTADELVLGPVIVAPTG